ncbi:single-stranded DNA-binding protein [Liquorilactobacillus vini]|uniref:single-stranded DNA-binding protein n=1 Tax=Liquorilactobacillus vini TaxID=238015 RepID=UPI00031F9ECE|nr:single-stranded DNA-binding protein [Liquorilactobacillus vini]
MLNTVILNGRLTSDVDIRYSQSGMAFGSTTLAVQRNFKNKLTGEYDSDFIRISLIGKTAENFANFFKKGNFVGVQGSIQTGSYEKNGQKIYTTEVLVDRFYFLETRSQNNSQQAPQQNSQQDPFMKNGENIEITDDSLPF